jgi:hypothetical protein
MRREKRLHVLFFILPPCAHRKGAIFVAAQILVLRAKRLASDFFAPNAPVIGAAASPMGKETVGKGHLNKAHPINCVLKRTVRSQNRTQFNKTSLSPLLSMDAASTKYNTHRERTPLPKKFGTNTGGNADILNI